MKLSHEEIEKKIDEYDHHLKNLPQETSHRKREIVEIKLLELKERYSLWKEKKFDDNAITACFNAIDDWLNGFEFTNRERELETIINPFSPPAYQLISAPMGYGKSRLLEIAHIRLKEQNWHCINLTLPKSGKYSIEQFTLDLLAEFKLTQDRLTTSEFDFSYASDCGRYLGFTIVNFFKRPIHNTDLKSYRNKTGQKEKICILIDQAERLDSSYENETSLVQELFEDFMPAMGETVRTNNQNITWRFIFSGRYISKWENKIYKLKMSLASYELQLFSPRTIAETINNYAHEQGKQPTDEKVRKMASLALYFSGGHPKCMVPVIKDGLNALIKDVESNEEKYYQKAILPVIDDIKAHIPEVYQVAKPLCVVRNISRNLLHEFSQSKFIQGFNSKFDLEKNLLGTFLFHRNKSFLADGIVRRILAIHLYYSNLEYYKKVCRKAIKCYRQELADPESLGPATLAVELLFLELQLYCIKEYSKESARKFLNKKFNQILTIVEEKRSKGALDIFKEADQLLKNDQELNLNLEYLAGIDINLFLTIMDERIKRSKQ